MNRPGILLVALVAAAVGSIATGEESTDEPLLFHEAKAILTAHCLKCHGPEKQQNGLRLDHGAAILHGGDSGPAIIAGKPAESLLIQAVTGTSETVSRMPL